MRWLLLALTLLCSCVSHSLVAIQTTEDHAEPDVICVVLVAHVRSARDIRQTIPALVAHANANLKEHGIVIDRVIYVADIDKPIFDRNKDRRRLFRHSKEIPNAIHVFMVLGIRNGDHTPAGMFVRSKTNECHEYILLSDGRRIGTLTHELGHLFDIPHEDSKDNLMWSGKRNEGAKFTDEQIEAIAQNARRHAKKCWS